MKKILVLNAGSSTLKYQLFNVDGENYEVVAKGNAERIGRDYLWQQLHNFLHQH